MSFSRRSFVVPVLVLVVVGVAAYANTFRVPFLFDDVASIVDNPTICRLWPPSDALSPPRDWGLTVSGRPILNLSFAINYAISGLHVWSYHAFNLLIHLLAGITLFGIVRRTLERPRLAATFGSRSTPLALAIAALWIVHPLQTEAVTYVVQRAESLMGLFFFLTLYAFIRAIDSPRPRLWRAISFFACLLGVGTKEVAALAPVMVFFYDRTFVSGNFRHAWRNHRWQHAALAATWLPLAWLILATGMNRGGTAGFGAGMSPLAFWPTQGEAITRYLALAVWPQPLVFDYGKIAAPSLATALLWAIPVVALAAGAIVALRRWPPAGFLGAWFFGILAPTSLVPGVVQMIVEHRMYLSLAAVIALVVCAAFRWFGMRATLTAVACLGLAAGAVTLRRNAIYRTELSLWEDTVAKRPQNARAHNNLGLALYRAGRLDDAIARYRESLRLDPALAQTHYNLGLALMSAGHAEEAVAAFEDAVRILPYFFNAHLNLGIELMHLGRATEALPHFAEAIRFDPSPAEAHFRLGVALASLKRFPEAIDHYAEALRLDPTHARASANWGVALFQMNELPAAIERYEASLRLNPDLSETHFNLGIALARLGRQAEARAQYAEAVRLDPNHAAAQLNLGVALGQSGDLAAAIEHLTLAVQLEPGSPEAHYNLAIALAQARNLPEAAAQYEAALRLRPGNADMHFRFALVLLGLHREREAAAQLEETLRLEPAHAAAQGILAKLRAGGGR